MENRYLESYLIKIKQEQKLLKEYNEALVHQLDNIERTTNRIDVLLNEVDHQVAEATKYTAAFYVDREMSMKLQLLLKGEIE